MTNHQTPWEESEHAMSLSSPRSEKGDALASVMDSALSMQDTQPAYETDSEDADDEEPPPYHPSSPAPVASPLSVPTTSQVEDPKIPEVWRMYQKLQSIPWTRYMPPRAQLSSDASTVTLVNIPENHTAETVSKVVLEQLNLPPQQHVKVIGRHQDWSGSKKVVDFELTLNVTPYFMGAHGESPVTVNWQSGCEMGARTTTGEAVGKEVESALVRCYRNKTVPQSIVVDRTITNWDKSYVCTSIHGLLGTVRYKGDVEITFPTTQTKVVINLPSKDAPKEKKGLFSSFVQSVAGYKTSYTIKAEWPYASHPVNVDELGSRSSDPARTFTSKSESAWFTDWEAVIRRAVVRNEKTILGLDSWMQNMTNPLRKAELPTSDWGANKY
ncbi:hypothetical protein B9Z65_8775 [Elsinoe australis]|uniref:Uncharacterized protein n=1 Tax=Elsinoe australis TaxID=40998 RepID=A0A2P7YER0_9PEZI|nr:hypothetical protein B9Z65_8775 [Elsinoe australis]